MIQMRMSYENPPVISRRLSAWQGMAVTKPKALRDHGVKDFGL
jgi:hypothetical protein